MIMKKNLLLVLLICFNLAYFSAVLKHQPHFGLIMQPQLGTTQPTMLLI